MLYSNSLHYGLRPAVTLEDGKEISYKQLLRRVNYLGTALCRELSLSGKKIAVCGKNCPQWCISYLAVSCGVGTVVPLDREMDAKQLWNALSFVGCKAIIADEKVCRKLLEEKKKLPRGFILICFSPTDRRVLLTFQRFLKREKNFWTQAVPITPDAN